jgi:hypothetical protein
VDKDPRQYFEDKHPGITYAGSKHPRIKQAEHLLNNTKPNPKGLAVIEGLWALSLALKYNLFVECFIFCPEMVFSSEAETMIDNCIQKAAESCLVSAKVFDKISHCPAAQEGPRQDSLNQQQSGYYFGWLRNTRQYGDNNTGC